MKKIILGAALAALSASAIADGPRLRPASNPLYEQECGSCHLAYQPGLLPVSSWSAVMNGLDNHFGSDASLEPADAKAIRQFLTTNAGRGRSALQGGKPVLRITALPWWRHEHEEEISPAVWKRPEVGSPANCGACHQNAAQGNFDEDNIRIPGGRP